MARAPKAAAPAPADIMPADVRLIDLRTVKPYEANARTHGPAQIEQIKESFRRFGFVGTIAYDDKGLAIGHGRQLAALSMWESGEEIMGPGKRDQLPRWHAPAVDISGLSDEDRRALIIADNKLALNAGWDEDILRAEMKALSELEFDMPVLGFDEAELASLLDFSADDDDDGQETQDGGQSAAGGNSGGLAAEFMIPPFSVLNAREGWWQDRKRRWIGLGIQSEVGRGGNLIGRSLPDRLSIIVPGHYSEAKAFIDKGRAEGLTDEEIEAKAIELYGAPKEAIPGGAGKNSVYRSKGFAEEADKRATPGGGGTTYGLAGAGGMAAQMAGGRKAKAFDDGAMAARATIRGDEDSQYLAVPGKGRAATASAMLPGDRKNYQPGESLNYSTQGWVLDKLGDEAGLAGGQTGTSIFDPVICELIYRWFSPKGGRVLDPFAGGSVRGIVAGALGRAYTGIDLRPEQIEANIVQWPPIAERLAGQDRPEGLAEPVAPRWVVGDSRLVLSAANEPEDDQIGDGYDLIFSCPPYGDLEVYSDDPADISTFSAVEFENAYRSIIDRAVARLADDRFACFVVGDYRDKKGIYANFVSKTIAAFEAAGAQLYNEVILVTAIGSLPIRAAKQFRSTRKFGKTHQNVLVFVKGDPRRAADALGPVDVSAALAELESDQLPADPEGDATPSSGGLGQFEVLGGEV